MSLTSTSASYVDSASYYHCGRPKYLVGIDVPRDRLVESLTGRNDHVSKQKLKIISIYGEGGLGKTTLAKKVFDKIAANFFLKAFVPVGRNPNIKRVLEDILYELDRKGNKDIHNAKKNQQQLIDLLREQLRNKRYFIIIDDIWDTKSWEIIECALIDNANGSRVMTTSRINDVTKGSRECCKLEPLSYDQSKQLFYSRLTYKSTSTFDQLDEQSTKFILAKCGGLPLAIITIASLLGDKRVEDWPKVYNSIKFGHEDNKAENTKKILLFSYFDLPCHLKTCLLYLSIYPEDRVIQKNTLVWKWIAEGFVRQEKGKALFEVGEGYFNELINRSIIQPANSPWSYMDMFETGTINGCRVHDMVLDLICSIAKEENFVTVLDNDEQHLSSQNNGRILAVHKRVLEQHDLANACKRQVVRSFNSFISGIELDSLLLCFRLLRVLCLEDCDTVSGDDAYRLKNVAQLRHLRYLGLAGTEIGELPMEIGDLRCLQALDLTETFIEELPQSVTLLRDLKSLLCYTHHGKPVKLPDRMGSLTSLEELRLNYVGQGDNFSGDCWSDPYLVDFVEELGKLTKLRVLQITTSEFSGSSNKALMESLNKLKSMEELYIDGDLYVYMEAEDDDPTPVNIWDDYSPGQLLRHLCLCSNKMPVWIDDASSLGNISYLNLSVASFISSDLRHLGSLPELRSLVLTCEKSDGNAMCGVIVAADGDAFPKLRYFHTNCSLMYVQGAMRCLESLTLFLTVRPNVEFGFDSFKCLHSLEKVRATTYCFQIRGAGTAEALRAALRRAVDQHPKSPTLEFI